MTYRCDYCHHQIYADRHFCPRFPSGGDQYAPGGLGTPEITEEQATAKSRELAMAQAQVVMKLMAPPEETKKPVMVTTEPEKVEAPPKAKSSSSPSSKSVSASLSEIDRILAQGKDTSPKA